MSKITRLCSNYELTVMAAPPGNEIAACKAAIVSYVTALEVQRDLAVDACRAFVEAWEKSCQLEKTDVALRMARIVIEAVPE